MNSTEKIQQLQKLIHGTLTPLINHDYWLLEVPFYPNVGDCLIWQGELDFLRTLPYKRKGMSSYESPIPNKIPKDDLILLQGGGNFGDLWLLPQQYRLDVIKKYPDNRIIILPQSVWFENNDNLKKCAEFLSSFPNVIICARDKYSYNLLTENLKNKILLVPDMAFCINTRRWEIPLKRNKSLLLKREDREQKQYQEIEKLVANKEITVCDWLTFSENSWQKNWLRRTKKYLPVINPWYAEHFYLPYMVNSGVQLIGSHDKIYSTRLHAAILSILLGKAEDLTWFDNSYGKNSSFYETWLSDLEGIKFIK